MEARIGRYRVEVATGFGPRVTGLSIDEGPELLARLDPATGLALDGGGFYRFHGGHRLWAAPEVPDVTYAPDDHECSVIRDGEALTVSAPVDRAGLVKEISVAAFAGGDALVIDHRLTSWGGTVDVAPWAITQVPLGGTAILPVSGPGDGLQANRSLVLWPYTDLWDDRIGWRGDLVLIDAAGGPPVKLGSGPAPGRIGYFHQGILFVKKIPAATEGDYPDRGAVGQVYVGQGFCELESMGPLVTLVDGASVTHRETWTVVDCADLEAACATVSGTVPSGRAR
ncbi:MAG: hypothetical protein ABWY62_00410 [Acidimicrobiia bacterium]